MSEWRVTDDEEWNTVHKPLYQAEIARLQAEWEAESAKAPRWYVSLALAAALVSVAYFAQHFR